MKTAFDVKERGINVKDDASTYTDAQGEPIFVEGFLSWNNTKYEWNNQTILAHFQQDLKIDFEQVNDFLRICSMNTVLSGK